MNEGFAGESYVCKKIKMFLSLDMDGTNLSLEMNYSHLPKIFKESEDTGREYYFFTNNSSKSQQDLY